MKQIFNSLGSNYTFPFTIKALSNILFPSKNAYQTLLHTLEKRFDGKAFLFYKGRDAIEYTLRALDIGKDCEVITQAFTCYAIEEAIKRTGAKPVYVDLAKDKLNPDCTSLEAALKTTVNAKAVIIQHTLGFPADITAIRTWCTKHHLLLIEDLAQSYGALDTKGQQVGAYGDAVILSFGRDKILDAVSGGACVIKVPHKTNEISGVVPNAIILRDMLYPLLTYVIRKTHSYGLGKIVHKIAVLLKLITSPVISPTTTMAAMPTAYAALALDQLARIDLQLQHRRKIASAYVHCFEEISLITNEEINRAACQRFPLLTNEPYKIVEILKKHHIYIADRWYRKPVDCGSFPCNTVYKPGSCPNAEDLAKHIINLPTHHSISTDDVHHIEMLLKQNQKHNAEPNYLPNY